MNEGMDSPALENGRVHPRRRLQAAAALGAALAITLGTPAVLAQSAGDAVRIETDGAVIQGTLIDKLPDGYLVRSEGRNLVIPYAKVTSIAKAPTPAPAEPPPPPITPAPSSAAPPDLAPPPPTLVAPAPPLSPAPAPLPAPPPRLRSPGLIAGGTVATIFGSIGIVAGVLVLPVGLLLKADDVCHDRTGTLTFDCEYGSGSALVKGGAATLITGGVLLAGGITMLAAGSGPKAQRRPLAALPALTVAPTGASLQWTF